MAPDVYMDYVTFPADPTFSLDELLRQDSPEPNTAGELCAVLLDMPPALVARVFMVLPANVLLDVLAAARTVDAAFNAAFNTAYSPAGHVDVLMAATPVQLCRWIDHLCRLSVNGLDEMFRPIIQHGSAASLHNLSMRARANEYWAAYDWLARHIPRPPPRPQQHVDVYTRDADLELAIARSLEYVPARVPRKPHSLVPDHNPAPGMCIICYGDLCRATTLPCGHRFDLDCIAEWYAKQSGEPTCPMCRAPFGAKK